jgi:hypothetical protein
MEKENPGLYREVEAHERGHAEQMLEAAKRDVSISVNLGGKDEPFSGRADVVLGKVINRWAEVTQKEYNEKRASGEIKKGKKAKDEFYADARKKFHSEVWSDAIDQVTAGMQKNIDVENQKHNEQDANRRAAEKLGEDNIQYNNGRKRITNFGTVLAND